MIVTKMNTKTILGVLVVFFAAVLAQTAFAGTYWYQGQAVYSDPVYSQQGYYGNNYNGNNNGYYGNGYANYGGYYNNGYPAVPYHQTGFYYNVQPYLEGFPYSYYYDSPGTYNLGRGNSYTIYNSGSANDWGYWQNSNAVYDNYHIDTRYYNYPQDGMYFDRYGRNYN